MYAWVNNPQTLPVLLEHYRAALYEGKLTNRSRSALAETLEFGFDKFGDIKHKASSSKDPSATGDNHGDVVIADALMWKMMKELGAGAPIEKPGDAALEAMNSMRTMAYRRQLFERQQQSGGRLDLLLRPRNW